MQFRTTKYIEILIKKIGPLLVASFCLFLTSRTHAQNAGDALLLKDSSYFTFSLPQDSLDVCTFELLVNPTQNLDTAFLLYIGDSYSSGFGLYTTRLAGVPFECAEILLGGVIESATGNQARLPLNTWTHLALTRSGNIWKLYKNGSLVGRGNRIATVASGKVMIGKGFAGAIDEVRYWNKELSQDEIRASMFQTLKGNEDALRSYYVMDIGYRRGDSVLINKANGGSTIDDAHIVVNGTLPTFVPSTVPLFDSPTPKCTLYNFPSHLQFFQRNTDDYAPMNFDGEIDDPGYDSIRLKKWKNDLFIGSWSLPLFYTGGIAHFHFLDSIHAEQSQYSYTLHVSKDTSERFIAEAADLVSGDAYLITGQSNAHPSINWYTNINPMFRTFGIQTAVGNTDNYDPADTSWGYGNGHGYGEIFGGPYLIGVWAHRLASQILSHNNLPTCFINGAAGGSTIEQNLPYDPAPVDLTNIYGRALYRSIKSGMQKKYRALIWYQGEYNTVDGYYNNFMELYHGWIRDYTDDSDSEVLKKIYVFQIHQGCVPGERNALRELERTLPDSLPRIDVMSTCGVYGHDGCHYDAFGYWHIGDNIYGLIARDIYRSVDTIDIEPPNINKAWYGDSTHDLIILRFSNVLQGLVLTPDTLVRGTLRPLKDYFYLDSISGSVRTVFVKGDSILLGLSGPSEAKQITYLPDETYNNDDSDIYEGPWIVNQRGIGALSFKNVSIDAYTPDTATANSGAHSELLATLQCTPNPSNSKITIFYSLSKFSPMRIEILDLLGKTTHTLESRYAQSGSYLQQYDLSVLPTGEYIVRLSAGSSILSQKIIFFR